VAGGGSGAGGGGGVKRGEQATKVMAVSSRTRKLARIKKLKWETGDITG